MSAHRSPYQAPPDLEGSFRSTNSTLFPMPNLSLDYDSSAEPDGSSLPFQHARPSSGDRQTAGTIPTLPPVPSLRLAPGVSTPPKRANYAHSRSWTFPSTFAPSYDTQSGRNPGDSEGQSSTPFSKPVDPTRLAANLQATLYEKIMAATWEDDGGKRARASHGEDLGKRAEVSTFSARDRALANLESLHEANRFTAGGYKDYEEIVTGSLCDLADAISGVDGFTEETSLLSLTQGLEGCMLPEKTDRDTT
ncbi:hypothetical protein CNBG0700 [Cryptococcus deneoformans B-3501A]|uniref:hypothetical protein n=1 Tax=Cryptococcus deneoformans (strain B-3501A) TaxID=283643 RepID=UPI000042F77C|nr:hypothetical protein CNBG0700 [Cryptococcus neoformans var. neoformans B-3501A]EAL19777.1 hypothetical protein CNBG0700 [Cryptococcus neoformans var. neoformans B-3501A]